MARAFWLRFADLQRCVTGFTPPTEGLVVAAGFVALKVKSQLFLDHCVDGEELSVDIAMWPKLMKDIACSMIESTARPDK